MFTGIIQSVGTVAEIEKKLDFAVINITDTKIVKSLSLGDSIAVNGVCLTVSHLDLSEDYFSADVMGVTLKNTNLKHLVSSSRVNLELPLSVSGRFDGHIVQGHVDGEIQLINIDEHENWRTMRFQINPELRRYVVKKGSICLNGVSLTVSDLADGWLEVSLIPVTLAETNLGLLQVGDTVNVEVDLLAKYVESILGKKQ
ncbi:MAG: riboflavin synthase [Candidatus Nanopelagicales bacterium]